MASVPNRANPLREYDYIKCLDLTTSTVNAVTITGSTVNATNLSGSNVFVISGYTALGAISRYQPVVYTTNAATTIAYVSGATAALQTGIVGVSAADYSNADAVTIIIRGIVPTGTYTTSGASVTLGGMVGNVMSGSGLRLGNATTINTVVGYAILTGATANTHYPVTLNIFPH